MDIGQQGLNCLDGFHLLLEGNQLPIVLLGLLLDLVLRELKLQTAKLDICYETRRDFSPDAYR